MECQDVANRGEQVTDEGGVPSAQPQRVRSEDLLQGWHELEIEHGDEVYRLRLTRNGKLILNK